MRDFVDDKRWMRNICRRNAGARAVGAVSFALLIFGSLGGTAAFAARETLKVKMSTSTTHIKVGDSFQLDVVITSSSTKALQELALPDLSQFRVLRDNRTKVRSTRRVGRQAVLQTVYRYTYLLTADTPGRKSIGGVRARRGRTIGKAREITIHVAASSQRPLARDEAGDPKASANGKLPDFFLDVSFNRNEAFVGEGVTLTTRLYATSLVSGRALDSPQWKNFWVEELGGAGSRPVQRKLAGKTYYVYTVSRRAMFPLNAGDLVIPAMSMQVETRAGAYGARSMVLRSEPARLLSKALPAQGQPRDFTLGNVGQWKLTAQLHPRRLRVGEAATLKVSASGNGNVGQLMLPTLEIDIAGARVFPASFSDHKTVTGGNVAGVKTGEMLVQPTKRGRVEVPSFVLEYFNPKTGKYELSRTKPIVMVVAAAKRSGTTHAGGKSRKEIAAGARPVHVGIAASESRAATWPAGAGIVFGLGAWIALGVQAGRRRRQGSDRGATAGKRAKARAKAMEAARVEKDLGRARALVMDALAERVDESVRGMPSDEMWAACERAEMEADRARALVAFFEAVDAVRFTPHTTSSRQQLFEEGARLVEALDGELR